jgi:NADPH:quinone reductase-like Zn-dependent oxidoreductase
VQFAKAAGATVIATTSSAEKAELLKELGAGHVINYKEVSHWGEKARALTPDGVGVDNIIEVGGPTTTMQSLKAVGMEGLISVIGFLGGGDGSPNFLEVFQQFSMVEACVLDPGCSSRLW